MVSNERVLHFKVMHAVELLETRVALFHWPPQRYHILCHLSTPIAILSSCRKLHSNWTENWRWTNPELYFILFKRNWIEPIYSLHIPPSETADFVENASG